MKIESFFMRVILEFFKKCNNFSIFLLFFEILNHLHKDIIFG
jgi:hypothetical protein